MTSYKSIAIDVGGVIVVKDYSDLSTKEDTLINSVEGAKLFPGALETIQKLSEKYELYILSFAGYNREVQTKQILLLHGFDKYIPKERWLFTRDRSQKIVLMKQHNIDLIIDDTFKIIQSVNNGGLNAIWFGQTTKPNYFKNVVTAVDWNEVSGILC